MQSQTRLGNTRYTDETELADEQWLGSESEELNSYVSFWLPGCLCFGYLTLWADTCPNCLIFTPSS